MRVTRASTSCVCSTGRATEHTRQKILEKICTYLISTLVRSRSLTAGPGSLGRSFGSAGMENIPSQATNSDVALLTRLTAGYGRRLALLPPMRRGKPRSDSLMPSEGTIVFMKKCFLKKSAR